MGSSFLQNLHVRELQNFLTLSEILDQVHLNDVLEDCRIWKTDSLGGFPCKSAKHEDGVQDFHFHNLIWKFGNLIFQMGLGSSLGLSV